VKKKSFKPLSPPAVSHAAVQASFEEIVGLIGAEKLRAVQAVNSELVTLYWQIGQFISLKLATAEWGEGVVANLAEHIARTQPGLRGFTRPNLFRMRQLFEAYGDNATVSAPMRQLPWTHHLQILSHALYLEALDRDHRKPHENPASGLLLCATKDGEVVEYALSRSLSRRWSPNTKRSCPTRSSGQPNSTSFTNC
jgi:hypothetical protein